MLSKKTNLFLSPSFLPLYSAILYGLSWVGFFNINLTFLTWFAFVPLFISLERKNTFNEFYHEVLIFCTVSAFILVHGFLLVPKNHLMILAGSATEILLSTIPFVVFYPIKKRFGFRFALMLFPFIMALWDWTYLHLEFSVGHLIVSHSQCRNTWLIQFIDLFGVQSIAFWVIGFNVLLFFAYKRHKDNVLSLKSILRFSVIVVGMITFPLLYGMYRKTQIVASPNKSLNVTLIHTNLFSVEKSEQKEIEFVKRLIEMTDSVYIELKNHNQETDLFVWHEGAISKAAKTAIMPLIDSAVKRWQTPLLTGIVTQADTSDKLANRVILISPNSNERPYYDKTHLTPFWEGFPYQHFLKRFHFFSLIDDSSYYKEGEQFQLITVKNRKGETVKIGTPICFEQNFPDIWREMVECGADCFILLSFESWFRPQYYRQQMANITLLRCIETRRWVARNSNGGETFVADAFGTILKHQRVLQTPLGF